MINTKTYNFTYERNASTSYLVIETSCEEGIMNYQVEMIAKNPNPSVLPLYIRRKDDALNFYYDITSKVSLLWLLKRKKLKKREFIGILCGIAKPLLEASGYFLKENSFILNENYIFVSPDLTEVSLTYLPMSSDSDYLKSYKELVLKLVTELADIEESPADNYLQRILGNIKQESFNIMDFDILLKEVSFEHYHEEKISDLEETHVDNAKKEPLLIPPQKAPKHNTYGDKKEGIPEKNNMKNTPIIVVALLQLVLITIFLILLKTKLLSNMNTEDSTSTYLGVLLILGAIDFLTVRGILLKKGDINKTYDNKKNKAEVIKFLDTNKKEDEKKITGGNRKKLITIVKKPHNDIVKEDSGVICERKNSYLSNNNCETEFLADDRDSGPYLQNCKDLFPEKIFINKNQFIIGRLKEQVDYVCGNSAVGKIHAEIIEREGVYYIKDINSRNGTFVNSLRIESNTEYEIKNKDQISLANCDYTFVVP